MPRPRNAGGADRILDTAEQLAQQRGFNGFSYADIAERLGMTKANIHHYFPSKAELGRALIVRYHEVFGRALLAIDQKSRSSPRKLQRYVELYDGVIRNDRMCLCGMLAAEYTTLPAAMQDELRRFFDANEVWLGAVLGAGKAARQLSFSEPPAERARLLLGALEGAMLVARTYADDARFRTAAKHALADVGVALKA